MKPQQYNLTAILNQEITDKKFFIISCRSSLFVRDHDHDLSSLLPNPSPLPGGTRRHFNALTSLQRSHNVVLTPCASWDPSLPLITKYAFFRVLSVSTYDFTIKNDDSYRHILSTILSTNRLCSNVNQLTIIRFDMFWTSQ